MVGGKYKGMDGIVGSNEPHQLEGSGKVCGHLRGSCMLGHRYRITVCA